MSIRTGVLVCFMAGLGLVLTAPASGGDFFGACCFLSGACGDDFTEVDCVSAGGIWAGADTLCSENVCQGACCLSDGGCMPTSNAGCVMLGGQFQGFQTSCANVVCAGACCLTDGCMDELSRAACDDIGGVYQGLDTSCKGTLCAMPADNCADADAISIGRTAISNVGATSDGPSPCSVIESDIWYDFTPQFSGAMTISTCGSLFDTAIAVYDGCACPVDVNSVLACNDDSDCNGDGLLEITSTVMIDVVAGQCYKIQIGGFLGARGDGFVDLIRAGNDFCDGAEFVTEGMTAFSNFGATDDGPPACGQIGSDVWFRYEAPFTGLVTVTTCGSGFDTVLAAYSDDSCPVDPRSLIACNDEGFCDDPPPAPGKGGPFSVIFLTVTEGQTYTLQVGGFAGAKGMGVLNIELVELAQACCLDNGSCVTLVAGDCVQLGGTPQGDGTTCADVICPFGACCVIPSGPGGPFCIETSPTNCAALQGEYLGDGVSCLDDPCLPTGACCFGVECIITDFATCESDFGTYLGDDTDCANDPCLSIGACCYADECQVTSEAFCVKNLSGFYQGGGTSCADAPCGPVGACCMGGLCSQLTELVCSIEQGVFVGAGTTCDDDPCSVGACCFDDQCQVLSLGECIKNFGGIYLGGGTTCDDAPCGPVGACCLGTQCVDVTELVCSADEGIFLGAGTSCIDSDCSVGACCFDDQCQELGFGECIKNFGGTFLGNGTTCDDGLCGPVGACCFGTECSELTELICAVQQGVFLGAGTTCVGGNPCDSSCPGDLDGDGAVTFDDVLAVLSNWGPCAACPEDIDGDGEVAFSDLLIVLAGFGPCP